MATLTQIKQRFWDNDGSLLAGGKVYIYLAGTSTLTNSYTDATGLVANTNPVILNAKGEASIWTNGLVKINVLNSADVQVTGYPVDNVGPTEYFGSDGTATISAITTITSGYLNKITILSGTTYTVTLPSANTIQDGSKLTFKCTASGGITISRASTDTIGMSSTTVTSIIMNNGDTLTLISNGSNQWVVLNGFIQSGSGSVGRTQNSKSAENKSVTDYGAVMNDNSAGAMALNAAALAAAMAANKSVMIPLGILWLPANSTIDIPAGTHLWGQGRWEGGSAIKGDGHIFHVITTVSEESSTFSDFSIQNNSIEGRLFTFAIGTDQGRIQFENMYFGKSTSHIYSAVGYYQVDWVFQNCKFENSSSFSRYFDGPSKMLDIGCYCVNNYQHLRLGDILPVYGFTSISSFYTIADQQAVHIVNNGANNSGGPIRFVDCWFENNGTINNAADIIIANSVAYTIGNVVFEGCQFAPPSASQTLRVQISNTGGGTVKAVTFKNCSIEGAVQLCDNVASVYNDNCYFANGIIGYRSLQHQLPYALTASGTYDPANMPTDGSGTSTTIACAGAAVGDPCVASLTSIGVNQVSITAFVDQADRVRVSLINKTGGALDIASGTLKVIVFKTP